MADKEIPDLTAATKPDGTEVIHAVQGVNSRKLTSEEIAAIGIAVSTEVGTAVSAIISNHGLYIRFTAATAVVWTINTGIFSARDEISICQAGAGTVTVTAGAGFTINSRGSRIITNGQFAVATLKFISGTSADLFGDLV